MAHGPDRWPAYGLEPSPQFPFRAEYQGGGVHAHLFVQDAGSGFASLRTAEHLVQQPDYPDPVYYLSFLGKYFYRNPSLRHLRVEQFREFIGIHKP